MSRRFFGISLIISLTACICLVILTIKINEKHKTRAIRNLVEFEYSDINNFANLLTSDSIKLYENFKSQFEENDEISKRYFSDSSNINFNNIVFSFLCVNILKRTLIEFKNVTIVSQNIIRAEIFINEIDETLFIDLIDENGKLKILNIFPLKSFVQKFQEIFIDEDIYANLMEE